jgi:hypothetical protein
MSLLLPIKQDVSCSSVGLMTLMNRKSLSLPGTEQLSEPYSRLTIEHGIFYSNRRIFLNI